MIPHGSTYSCEVRESSKAVIILHSVLGSRNPTSNPVSPRPRADATGAAAFPPSRGALSLWRPKKGTKIESKGVLNRKLIKKGHGSGSPEIEPFVEPGFLTSSPGKRVSLSVLGLGLRLWAQ